MKREYIEKVANTLIEQLEQGTAPFQKPWKPGELRLPFNPTTGKEYRGVNNMWLTMQGRGDPRWMTYKQAGAAGAQVIKGSKSTQIVYWKFRDEQVLKDAAGKPVLDETGKPKKVSVELERPRSFFANVFNGEQIEGLPPLETKPLGPEPERHARADAVLENSGAKINHVSGDRAFYHTGTDSITLPERSQFNSAEGYYRVALHELGHWTGHKSRLDRDLAHPFGSEGYAKEELRAEISSLMLGERLEIGHDPGQHGAYVKSWIKALEDDPREIFRAASDAEKISTHIASFENEYPLTLEEKLHMSDQAAIEAEQQNTELTYHVSGLYRGDGTDCTSLADAFEEYGASEGSAISGGVVIHVRSGGPETQVLGHDWYNDGSNHRYSYASPEVKDYHDALQSGDLGEVELRAVEIAAENSIRTVIERDAATQTQQVERGAQQQRTYLAVPYSEKDEAKRFGARWDKAQKSWYAPEGVDLKVSGLDRWSHDAVAPKSSPEMSETVQAQFARALEAEGLAVKGEPIADGKIHRVPVEGERPGGTSGAYALHLNGNMAGGYIENFKTGTKTNWKQEGVVDALSPEARAQLRKENAERQKQRDTDLREKQERTAEAAEMLFFQSPIATADNAYCKAKGIKDPRKADWREVPAAGSHALRELGVFIAKTPSEAKAMRAENPDGSVFMKGDLLVPGRDIKGKLWTVQAINPRFKSFMKGGRKQGVFAIAGGHIFENPIHKDSPDKPVILAEGAATGDTVSRLSGQTVVVAFDSGNLEHVAREIRGKLPNHEMLIAADNDHQAAGQIDRDGKPKKNVGLMKAEDVAKETGAGVAAPPFKKDDKGSDWNDLAGSLGDDEAKRLLHEKLAVAKRDAAVQSERLTTLARTRDMEAQNDPSTAADDDYIAKERGKSAETIAQASDQQTQVNGMIADAKAGPVQRVSSTLKALVGYKRTALREEVKDERQKVLGGTSDDKERSVKVKGQGAKVKKAKSRAIDHEIDF